MFDSRESIEFTVAVVVEHLICVLGVLLLARWLLKTSLGRTALADSAPRRNSMPLYLPLIPLFIWFGPVPIVLLIVQKLVPDLGAWQSAFLDNCIFGVGAIGTIVLMLVLAWAHFARRLRGFGLDARTMAGDFGAALVNLLAVWPLIMAAMIVTVFFAELIWGQKYEMERHQELNLIIEYPQLPLRILIVVVAVLVAPVLEEMLFRGLFQTAIRSLFEARVVSRACRGDARDTRTSSAQGRVWLAIVISSGLFAMMHANPGHWPALFVLGIGMGYAYEKSGSLLQPIFIHALFNATTIAATLSQ